MPALAHALDRSEDALAAAVPSFDEIYTAHVAFVWRTLRTFGVADAHLEDAVQDVFVVVHRRLPEWEGRAQITTWLFAIARRVASSQRRKVGNARTEPMVDEPAGGADTFAAIQRAQASATVMAILDAMDEDKRIVFALVELEQLSVPEVAKLLSINLNTAYSRLRLARAAFETAVKARMNP
ncbi:MAG: sigma-70 family RNA polymerase sigma factor [Kofleriaceae bacterium]|nr:sigma-70 family RNA polymerase sigma factor [Kofleriaceae bacterium]